MKKGKAKPVDPHGKCPECGASWDGGEIPEPMRGHYRPPYRWSRLLGHEDPARYDGVSWDYCPDCGARWDARTGELVEAGKKNGD